MLMLSITVGYVFMEFVAVWQDLRHVNHFQNNSVLEQLLPLALPRSQVFLSLLAYAVYLVSGAAPSACRANSITISRFSLYASSAVGDLQCKLLLFLQLFICMYYMQRHMRITWCCCCITV